eukprot:COSAG02_NODE_21630_length_781_cov_0.545455_2_plen_120_part_01
MVGIRCEWHQRDGRHAAALKHAEQTTQGGESSGSGGFWNHQQFGRDANGNPVAGKQSTFNASREARKAVSSSQVEAAAPEPAPEQRRKSSAASRDVKATREKARIAAQTAATRTPTMSPE